MIEKEFCEGKSTALIEVLAKTSELQGAQVNLFVEQMKRESVLQEIEDMEAQVEQLLNRINNRKDKANKIAAKITAINEEFFSEN